MTDRELIDSLIAKRLTCDKDCFALANRFLNANGHQGLIERIGDDDLDFSIVQKLEN